MKKDYEKKYKETVAYLKNCIKIIDQAQAEEIKINYTNHLSGYINGLSED